MDTLEKEIWTIGHSTRSIEEFIDILNFYGIKTLIDVRRFPGSRKFPHFNREDLAASLAQSNINYSHLESLGGRRKVHPDSQNTAWRLASFRGYADHMETSEFKNAVKILEDETEHSRVAYMCSEAVWWSCHRSLISDYLKVKGWRVIHIMDKNKVMDHPYTKPASIVDGKLSYKQ